MITDLPTKRCDSDKHFSEFVPTRWRQKSSGIDMEQNYVTVTLCIRDSWGSSNAGLRSLLASVPKAQAIGLSSKVLLRRRV